MIPLVGADSRLRCRIEVDVLLVESERRKGISLRGEILRFGRDAGVTGEHDPEL